jgi:alpha-tubulin suppressor-like RCC1 family protein
MLGGFADSDSARFRLANNPPVGCPAREPGISLAFTDVRSPGASHAPVAYPEGQPLALLLSGGLAGSACEAVTGSDATRPVGPWASVSVGGSFACGMTASDMRAYCWGENNAGQLGTGSADGPEDCGAPCSTHPVAVTGDLRFASVSAGGAHACGLTTEGAAYCWGSNSRGQLGTSTSESCSSEPCSTRPVRVSSNLTWSSITAGGQHTCALTQAGDAYCWGWNFSGQLGNGASSMTGSVSEPGPVRVVGGFTFELLSAGGAHTCGLTTDGRGFCWGLGRTGALGTREGEVIGGGWVVRPAAVAGGHTFATISADGHSCGVTTNGRAYCWGSNASNQLGVGPTTFGPENCTATVHPCSTTPVAVAGGLRFTTVIAGPDYACGIATSRAAYCWGDNSWGQLGNGTTRGADAPARVLGGLTFRALSTGGTATIAGIAAVTCGVTVEGAAYCWGSNRRGELGSGARTTTEANPPGRTTPALVAPPREG